ncbi:MAG: PDZ domain-containing protein [Planctomycetota bacterium]
MRLASRPRQTTRLVGIAFALVATSLIADNHAPAQQSGSRSGRTPEYWIKQLSSDHHRRREAAVLQLIKAGVSIIPLLDAPLKSGELELTLQSVRILREVALREPAVDESLAWGKLVELSTSGGGNLAATAAAALEDIRVGRNKEAKRTLAGIGVFVGYGNVVINSRAIANQLPVVHIDDTWNGDIKPLRLLRWIRRFNHARLENKAVTSDVLDNVAQLPDLETMVLIDGELNAAGVEALRACKSLDSIEFRYVRFTPDAVDVLHKLPVRVQMTLMGTGLNRQDCDKIAKRMPGVYVELKRGAFLGVNCQSSNETRYCLISGITSGGAAAEAGLPKDCLIVRIDDHKITRFKDLQEVIAEHSPGDEVKITYVEAGKPPQVVTAKLQRQETDRFTRFADH